MLTKIPRPQLGDKMFRNTLIGLREEAMVVSVTSHKSGVNWTAVMMTKNGVEFIGSDKEHRGAFDWAPISWQYDETRNTWVVPEEDQTAAEAKVVGEKSWDIPQPLPNEKYMSWRSRVYREIPDLKKEDTAAEILSAAWKGEAEQEALSAK
jgi:hypothetical protein|tara:strand:+ start:404 stop:856 length:453 start_codon:yes stop_codon:yes gene_type:complete